MRGREIGACRLWIDCRVMASVTVQKTIRAAPERVFAISTDLENLAERVSGIESVEVLTEGPMREGTRWRETRTMLGKQATEEMWVTRFEPPRSLVVEAESHGAHYRTEFRFEPEGLGTRVTMVFGARPLTLAARIFSVIGVLAMGSIRKTLERDLDDVKRAAEEATGESAG